MVGWASRPQYKLRPFLTRLVAALNMVRLINVRKVFAPSKAFLAADELATLLYAIEMKACDTRWSGPWLIYLGGAAAGGAEERDQLPAFVHYGIRRWRRRGLKRRFWLFGQVTLLISGFPGDRLLKMRVRVLKLDALVHAGVLAGAQRVWSRQFDFFRHPGPWNHRLVIAHERVRVRWSFAAMRRTFRSPYQDPTHRTRTIIRSPTIEGSVRGYRCC